MRKKKSPATIGNNNEHRCIKYVLQNYHIYGVQPTKNYHDKKGKLVTISNHIQKTQPFGDMFSVEYKNEFGTVCKAGWDIITIPQTDEIRTAGGVVKTSVYLIQSKTNFKILSNLNYIRALCDFKVPSFVKKQLFNWVTGKDEPIITNL